MGMRGNVRILAPTALEYWMARLVLPAETVQRCGVALRHQRREAGPGSAILVGLAGALDPDLAVGTVFIPDRVAVMHERPADCDRELVRYLLAAADSLGLRTGSGTLLTAPTIITGRARQAWAARGYVAADMETGLLRQQNPRTATVRVILDSPRRSISDRWSSPRMAALSPRLWRELPWLARAAPWYALRAAQVARTALDALRLEAEA